MRRKRHVSRRHRRGEITLEWVILGTLLAFGVIGGLGVARNAMIAELSDIAQAISALHFF